MLTHEEYMQRCVQLAELGSGEVAPNPMVGALIVNHDGMIIGEGWHKKFGEAHAEVNAINAVFAAQKDEQLPFSTLYVSLEPCSHFGKTPPCTSLVIRHKIPRVVIGCRDPFKNVNGTGVRQLSDARIEVTEHILEKECIHLNRRFMTFQQQQRPYVIIKWAQTADGFMGRESSDQQKQGRLQISNELSSRLVHKWRKEEAAILVGTNTALLDNPMLTTRDWPGRSPVRIFIDMDLKVPQSHHLYDNKVMTIVFTGTKEGRDNNILYVAIDKAADMVGQIMEHLFRLEIQSLIVEGGARLIDSFLNSGLWDEARVVTGTFAAGSGLPAPLLNNAILTKRQDLMGDTVSFYTRGN
jgi:diaminohydroxyphosphoribosylaminopyrimidine deaminase/5-amino-6-(5-phosphoribosylamino)uracil reductase